MSSVQDFYAVLGVPAEAGEADIRKAYHSLARRLHPDVNTHPGAKLQYAKVSDAFETLNNPLTRHEFDTKSKANEKQQYFSLRITPSKHSMAAMNELQVLYLLVEIVPNRELGREKVVTPLNLGLVIDRSVSMNGPRLERIKVAAHQIIEQLAPQDILSIVSFSDRAELLVKAAPISDKGAAKAMVTMMQAGGGTEIFQGLQMGYDEVHRFVGHNRISHVILITDGRTFGDEANCLDLARKAATEGIGISAMGIGDEWNDVFLDQMVSLAGGNSEYINTPSAVIRFLNEKVRSLGNALADRVSVSVAPDPDIKVESIFRLTPSPQQMSAEADPIPIGQIDSSNNTNLLIQLQMPALPVPGYRTLLRLEVGGDVVWDAHTHYELIADTSIEVAPNPPPEEPPVQIIDALGKLTLYKMQQKAVEAASKGNVQAATRRLENLATRLLAAGEEELANQAMAEAKRVSATSSLSEEGSKRLKYGTRSLIDGAIKSTKQINGGSRTKRIDGTGNIDSANTPKGSEPK